MPIVVLPVNGVAPVVITAPTVPAVVLGTVAVSNVEVPA